MRLIDADALTKKLQHLWNIHDDVDFNNKDVWDELAIAPTIDAVEVVRCKNCKHYVGEMFFGIEAFWCNRKYKQGSGMMELTDLNDFCSKGERKTDELDTM